MDKRAKAGYMMSLADAIKFYERCIEAETALGQKLTREEREHLLQAMNLGKEVTVEDVRDLMQGKKVLYVKDGNESL